MNLYKPGSVVGGGHGLQGSVQTSTAHLFDLFVSLTAVGLLLSFHDFLAVVYLLFTVAAVANSFDKKVDEYCQIDT